MGRQINNGNDDIQSALSKSSIALGDILDVQAIQIVMDTFFALTKSGNAILDIQGNVLVATGWQDICMKFHRKHPDTCQNCKESDTLLASGVQPGTYKLYRCKNGLWDIVTPIIVEDKHVGNLYLGQFLFEDETPDYDAFRLAAHKYGFDENEYIAALDRAPRMSRDTIHHAMEFCIQFANMVSIMGFNNIQLERKVAAQTQELIAMNEELTAQNEEVIAMNEVLLAQNEEISSMNKEIESLNQNLVGVNENLERRVAERTADLLGAHQELTAQLEELKQTQEDLLREKVFVEAVLEGIPGYLYVYDDQGALVRWNKKHETMTGYSAEELAQMTLAKWFEGDDAVRVAAAVAEVFSTGYGEVEAHLLIKGGEKLHIHSNGVRLIFDGKTYFTGVGMDITERKRAEAALASSEAQLKTLVETIPDLIWLKNPEGVYLSCNTMFEKFFGAKKTDIIGKSDYDFVSKEMADFFREKDKAAIAAGKACVNEEWLTFASDGHTVLVETIKVPMYDAGGALIGVLGIARDITERVRHEQEILRDAQLATRVQNALLSTPSSTEYLEISSIYKPFSYVGGDLYFLDWRYGGNMLRGFILDATGHGLGTALHTAALHVLLREVNERDLPLAEAMRWLNKRAGEYFDEATFAGALGFELDLEIRQLRWVCAGMPELWMATKTISGAVIKAGMFLGLKEDERFEMHSMPIEVGDSFYFMTDGLTDQLDRSSELPLNQYAEMVALLRALSESKGGKDDATAVCIHVNALPQSTVRQDGWPRVLRFNGYGDYQRLKSEVSRILSEATCLPHSLQEVAVHEALANAMECRDGAPRQHKARIRFNKIGARFIVRVKTSRIGFAGNAILRRLRSHPEEMFSFVEDASMGRGIPMMLSISHKMTYNSEGTEVLLAWRL